MTSDTLRAIAGLDVFPVISLVLFVVVFVGMLVRTATLDRQQLAQCARLPLTDDPDNQPSSRSLRYPKE